jgi:prepilin-type N-terminal cleavage/methylation domain-containing protein
MMRVRGFTLVEMVLVLILLGLVTAMALPAMLGGFNAFVQQRETTEIERQAMLALERMTREIRPGTDILVGANQITFDRDGTSTTIGHDAAANELYLDRGGARTLASRVTGVSFSEESFEDARYIHVQFDVADSTHTWRTTLYPRNDQ